MIHELVMVCPFPLIEAQKKMATLQSGDELKLILIARKRRKLFQIGQQNGYPVTNYEQIDNASWTITPKV